MNILLIYPKFPDTFWSFNHAVSFIGQKAAFPPLGLLTVAARLPQKWSKRLVDTNVERLSETDLLWADMVFIGGMTVQRESACRINVDGTTNILPRMGMEALSKGYQRIMEQIYSPSNYYRRVRTQLRDLAPPEVFQPLGFQRFFSFFRAGLRLGILGKERFCSWQLILWTLLRKPRLISVAVTLSIYGYHYRKMCERYIY